MHIDCDRRIRKEKKGSSGNQNNRDWGSFPVAYETFRSTGMKRTKRPEERISRYIRN